MMLLLTMVTWLLSHVMVSTSTEEYQHSIQTVRPIAAAKDIGISPPAYAKYHHSDPMSRSAAKTIDIEISYFGPGTHRPSKPTSRPAAADIYTDRSYSGYAYSFANDTAEPYVSHWDHGSMVRDKAPTTVLLNPDKTFHSFGYEAMNKYVELVDDGEEDGWRFITDFNELLYQQTISRDVDILDVKGKSTPALEVFAMVIAYLKNEILKDVKLKANGITDDDVTYVIIVPATLSEAAKQFIREAGTHTMVGISNDQLSLVLEAEAAAIYCALEKTENNKTNPLPEGQRYIVVEITGEAVDIATYEIHKGPLLYGVHVAREYGIGGQYFNRKCLEFIAETFRKDIFLEWKTTVYSDYLDMITTIEEIKMQIGEDDSDVKIKIYPSLTNLYKTRSRKTISEVQSVEYDSPITSIVMNGIFLKSSFLRSFLEHVTLRIEGHIKTITKDLSNVHTIFLVGDLAESRFINASMASKFPNVSFIVPDKPGIAALKGAVRSLIPRNTGIIVDRVAMHSYGIDETNAFEKGSDTGKCKTVLDNSKMCTHVTTTKHIYAMLQESKHRPVDIVLYQCTKTFPIYTTDEGCTILGRSTMHPPKRGWPDSFNYTVEMVVGEAGFEFFVKTKLYREHEAKLDFLD